MGWKQFESFCWRDLIKVPHLLTVPNPWNNWVNLQHRLMSFW